jgi:hypothetical protein
MPAFVWESAEAKVGGLFLSSESVDGRRDWVARLVLLCPLSTSYKLAFFKSSLSQPL